MIDVAILPVFLVAVVLLAISPGPDLLLISTYSSTRGFRSGLMLSIGIFIAGMVQTLLVAFGLGQLLEAMPSLAVLVKAAGALYLSWLGIKRAPCISPGSASICCATGATTGPGRRRSSPPRPWTTGALSAGGCSTTL